MQFRCCWVTLCLVSLLLLWLPRKCHCDVDRAAVHMFNAFTRIKEEGMGLDQIQDHINGQHIVVSPMNGNEIIEKLTEELGNAFGQVFGAVRNIKEKVEEIYRAEGFNASGFVKCCDVDEGTLEMNPRFGYPTGDRICYRISTDTADNSLTPASREMEDIMVENSQFDMVTWQYFSTEMGVHVKFPSKRDSACRSYDPRTRPWYVEVATPKPKDIVILFDKSGSMSNLLELSKSAVLKVLGTLNPKDRIGLVTFSSEAETPPGTEQEWCYANNLAFATKDVINYLSNYVTKIRAEGDTDYVEALERGFDYFKRAGSVGGSSRGKGLLLLTDGARVSSDTVLTRLSQLNAEQDNKVMMLTYGLGESLETGSIQLLKDIANMTIYNSTAGDRTIGRFTHIMDADNLRYQLASYYNAFATQETIDLPIVTTPYIDFAGLGHITSVCLPVYDTQNSLKGITCIDITIRELTSSFVEFREGQNAYAFIIDDSGRTLIHPRLPKPGSNFDTRPVIVNIDVLEPEAKEHGILDEMRNLSTGERRIESTIPQSRGDPSLEGVNDRKLVASYHFKRIENTKFCACLVVTYEDKSIETLTNEHDEDFTYHRLDLQTDLQTCEHGHTEVLKDKSTVKFAPFAFQNPTVYRHTQEREDTVERYERFMEGDIDTSNKFRDGIRETVYVTKGLEQIWKATTLPKTWLYHFVFASVEGVFRTYPGAQLTQAYDHTLQQWYIKAIGNYPRLTFTTLHDSELSGQKVVTIAKAIVGGGSTEAIVGVAGVQVDLAFIETTLREYIPECRERGIECMLMDDSGFVIFHPRLLEQLQESKSFSIADLEGEIAGFLLRNNHMTINRCDDFAWKKRYQTLKLTLSNPVDNFHNYPRIFISPIQNSNVYIIIKNKTAQYETCKSCSGANMPYECVLNALDGNECICPCFTNLRFQYCNNTFASSESNGISPCTQSLENEDHIRDSGNQPDRNAPQCFAYNCADMDDSWQCAMLGSQCEWCSAKAKCVAKESCEGEADRSQSKESAKEGGSGISIGAIVAPVVILVLIAVGITLFLLWRKNDYSCPNMGKFRARPQDDPYNDLTECVASSGTRSTDTTGETSLSSFETGTVNPMPTKPPRYVAEPAVMTEPPVPCTTVLRSSYIDTNEKPHWTERVDYLTKADLTAVDGHALPPVPPQPCKPPVTSAVRTEVKNDHLNPVVSHNQGQDGSGGSVQSFQNVNPTAAYATQRNQGAAGFSQPLASYQSGDYKLYSKNTDKIKQLSKDIEKAKLDEAIAKSRQQQLELERKKVALDANGESLEEADDGQPQPVHATSEAETSTDDGFNNGEISGSEMDSESTVSQRPEMTAYTDVLDV